MKLEKKRLAKTSGRIMLVALSVLTIFSANGMQAHATDSKTTRAGAGPLYWIAYENPFVTDTAISEARWQANVDWVANNFKSYGYNMVSTDGWIEGATQTNANGYILKHNDAWTNGWQYWANYAAAKGLSMGVYYNPLWVTQAAVRDTSKLVKGTNIPVANIIRAGDMFNGNPDPAKQLYWVDVTKPGAKEYIQGYVNYFKSMGVKFLRVDFLSWYESGSAIGAPAGAQAHGSANYATALQWMQQAAGPDMTLSLVMPNLYNHAANEMKTGDMIRIDDDAATGGWEQISQGSFGDLRQTWIDHWSQWANPFQGFTGFSDISGRGSMILDGDFFRLNTFSGPYADNEKRAAISLYTMAGSPLAIADQYDTIGSNAGYYQNQDLLNVHKDGFVGKPVYYNGNPFEPTVQGQPDTGSRDSERWLGQTTDGNWVVAVFNRGDAAAAKSLDFNSLLGLPNGADVYDIWSHADLGFKTNQTLTLQPHDVSLVKVIPNTANSSINRYQASVATLRGGAHFNNNHSGYSGMGFVDKLEAGSAGANVLFAVNAPTAGTYDLNIGYANSMGYNGTATYTVQDANSTQTSSGKVTLPNLANWDAWGNAHQPVTLSAGLNYITIERNGDDIGSFNLNYIELNNRTPQAVNLLVNPSFETGDLSGWSEWHPAGQAPSFGVDSANPRSGKSKLYFWNNATPYQQSVHQTVNVPNGTYRVSGWVKLQAFSGVNPTASRMEVGNYGGAQVNVNFLPSANWQQVSSTVTVTNGQLDVGFYVNGDKNTSLEIDDVVITKQ
jgi:alpha-glucosidase